MKKFAGFVVFALCSFFGFSVPGFGQAQQFNPNTQINWSVPVTGVAPTFPGLNLAGPLLLPTAGSAGQVFTYQGTSAAPTWTTPSGLPAGVAGDGFNGLSVAGVVTQSSAQPNGLIVLGDSTSSCGAYGNNVNNTCAVNNAWGWTYWMNLQYPGGVTGYGVGGSYITDIDQKQLFPLGLYSWGSEPPAVLDTGLNDRNYTTTYQQNAIFQPAHLAALYRRHITAENFTPAGSGAMNCTSDFALNATRIGANAPTYESATVGGNCQGTVTTAAGQPIVFMGEMMDGNTGTATLYIDGAAVGTMQNGNAGSATYAGNTGNCVCTTTLYTTQSPLAYAFLPASGAGTHSVEALVATASGTGASLIGWGTTGPPQALSAPAVNTGAPRTAETGVLRVPGWSSSPTLVDNVIEALIQADIATVAGQSSDVEYVPGLAGNYATFPATAYQPSAVADIGSGNYYLDITYPFATSSSCNASTGLVTLVFSSNVSSSVKPGDLEIVAGMTSEPTLNTTTFWNLQTISGSGSTSTATLLQPGFACAGWTAVAESGGGRMSRHFYSNPHPNGLGTNSGYFQKYLAINHRLKAPGGGARFIPPTSFSLNLNTLAAGVSYSATGSDGIVQIDMTGANSLTLPASTPYVGPFVFTNYGSSPLPIVAGAGAGISAIPRYIAAGQALSLYNSNGTWWETGHGTANIVSVGTGNYTVTGAEDAIYVSGTGSNTLTFASPASKPGRPLIINYGSSTVAFAAGSGANIAGIQQTTLAAGGGMTASAGNTSGGSANWFNGSNGAAAAAGPATSLNLAKLVETASYATTGAEAIIEMSCSSCTLTLTGTPTNSGPFYLINFGSSAIAIAAGAGASLNNVPTSLAANNAISFSAGSSGAYFLTGTTVATAASGTATALNLPFSAQGGNYTLAGTEGVVRFYNSGQTLTLPQTPTNNGPFLILNSGSGALTIAAGTGANLLQVPTSLPAGNGMIVSASGGNWYMSGTTVAVPTALNLNKLVTNVNYTMTGGEGIVEIASGATLTLPSSPTYAGPFVITNFGSPTVTIAAGSGASLNGIPASLLGLQSMAIHYGSSGAWYLDAITQFNLPSNRIGTFTCTAGGTITISNTKEAAASLVAISLNTAGGTITTAPAMKTVTAGTGFTVLCAAADTSVYNYAVMN